MDKRPYLASIRRNEGYEYEYDKGEKKKGGRILVKVCVSIRAFPGRRVLPRAIYQDPERQSRRMQLPGHAFMLSP